MIMTMALFLLSALSSSGAEPRPLATRETVVEKAPRGAEYRHDRFGPVYGASPDLTRAAIVYGENRKEFAAMGGQRTQLFDQVSSPQFSRDGRQVFFYAERRSGDESTYTTFLNFREEDVYDRMPSSPEFSRGGRVAYVVENSSGVVSGGGFSMTLTKKAVVVDGQRGPWHARSVSSLAFNPATEQASYVAREDAGWFVVTLSSVGPPARTPVRCRVPESGGSPQLAFDVRGRRHVIVDGRDGAAACVEIDGVVDSSYQKIGMVQIDASGGIAYVGSRGGRHYVVTHLGERGPYERVHKLGIADGRPIWTALDGGNYRIATPVKEFEVDSPVESCLASADMRHAACFAASGTHGLDVMVDGTAIASYGAGGARPRWPYSFDFDDSGRWLAYTVSTDKEDFALLHDVANGAVYKTRAYDSGIARLRIKNGELIFLVSKGRETIRVASALPR